MPAILIDYFANYGYLAVFCFVLVLELGMAGLPNEVVLLSLGHLSYKAGLSLPLVLLVVTIADMMGSILLYLLFYHGKSWLLMLKPKWIQIPYRKIDKLKEKIAAGNGRTILLGKLTPFVRSYIPVVAGLMQVSPLLYTRIVFATALIWSGGWVVAGWMFRVMIF